MKTILFARLETLKNANLFQDFIKITEAIQHNSKTFLKIFLISDQIIFYLPWLRELLLKMFKIYKLFSELEELLVTKLKISLNLIFETGCTFLHNICNLFHWSFSG